MATSTAHRDRTDNHQFIQMLRIRELGGGWRWTVATAKHLFQIHLGHTASGVVGVVIVLRINHKASQNPLHLLGNLVEQKFQLARFNILCDIVVRMEPFTRLLKSLTYHH